MVPRRKFSINCAYKFLISNKVVDFPVDVFEIIDNNGWGLMTDIEYMKAKGVDRWEIEEMMQNGDAMVVLEKGLYTIVYKIRFPKRVRFSLAHEIGHIVMNHLIEFPIVESVELYDALEKEADVFATRLLSPPVVMWEEGIETLESVISFFNVSKSCAANRIKEHKGLSRDCPSIPKSAVSYERLYRKQRGGDNVYTPKKEEVVCFNKPG